MAEGLKSCGWPVDDLSMLVLLTLLTGGYAAVVVWVLRARSRARDGVHPTPAALSLPVDDRPPASAVGWPPSGEAFTAYVDEGIAALDAFLSEGYAA